jgi:hypothetical protein
MRRLTGCALPPIAALAQVASRHARSPDPGAEHDPRVGAGGGARHVT